MQFETKFQRLVSGVGVGVLFTCSLHQTQAVMNPSVQINFRHKLVVSTNKTRWHILFVIMSSVVNSKLKRMATILSTMWLKQFRFKPSPQGVNSKNAIDTRCLHGEYLLDIEARHKHSESSSQSCWTIIKLTHVDTNNLLRDNKQNQFVVSMFKTIEYLKGWV